jgi:hypothetical protein
MMSSDWTYKGQPVTEMPVGYEGFVYRITLPDGRFYIGQKKLTFRKTKTVKGKKVRQLVESDWQDYFGSSDEVKDLVSKLGPDGFRREILYLCQTKSIMNYVEACLIFSTGSLLSDKFVNRWVSTRINSGTIVGKIQEHYHLPEFQLIEKELKKPKKKV